MSQTSGSPPISSTDHVVVAIGASAGGLESLERLFTHLPVDTGKAFVVLQHLSPDFKSLMDELLSRRTQMQVRPAEHEMLVEPNTVYLLPPQKEMIIRQRRLLLNDRDPRHGLTLPIDLFFRSLAQDAGDRAVAVILSGSGSDGSRGVQEISKAGGTVFCESPDTAQFNGMPLSAMRTGTVDQVLPPEEIALAVAAVGRPDPTITSGGRASNDERGVDAILRLLREEYAIDFSHYKAGTVTRRIERRLAMNRSIDIDMYVEQLRRDPRELSSLYEDLLIGVTRFFRDDEAFEALEHRIIPELVERTDTEEQIRVWVPGCATGQEAYSIAMLLHERLSARKRPVKLKILATDVHKASLEVASAGLYSAEQLSGMSPERIRQFFTLTPSGYQISQTVRESIVFAPHNLIRDSPFTKMDLITCRNLLIYFQPHAQKTVLTLFHFALKPGGFLFLGSSESPGTLIDEFDTVDEQAKIYRKRRDIGLPRDLKLPLPRSGTLPRAVPSPAQRTPGVTPHLLALYDRLLDRFMPPSFLVDDQGQLVDTFGGVETLLKIRSRRPSQNLLEMLDGDMRAVVSGALHRVRRDLESVRYPAVMTSSDSRSISLIAEPLRDAHGGLTHVLLTLAGEEAGAPAALVPPFADILGAGLTPDGLAPDHGLSLDQQKALEDELTFTKHNLQTAVQEQETANEELQATNEELVAANEELQSTNEELHSVNEEMYTVNAEYQKKNLELQELNNDIEHLLNGTDVATMFLDRQLCIRKFTPRIAETFRVIPNDIGRPLRTFTHDLLHPTLMADIERVLQEGVTLESQTWDKRQRCLFLRILPYRARTRDGSDAPFSSASADRHNGPDGVVLTLTDISALEHARAKLAQLSAIVESSDEAIIGKTLDGVVTTWNMGAARLYGYAPEEAIGRHASFLYPPGRKDEIDAVVRMVRSGGAVERLETQRLRKDGTLVDISVTFSPIRDSSQAIVGISGISRDITQLIRARQEIAEREERIRLLLDSTAEAIYGIDLSGICIFCNSACARLLGYDSPAAIVGRQVHPLIHHTKPDGTPSSPERSPIFEAMRHREGSHVTDEVIWRADGTSFPAEYWSHPILRNDEVIGAVVTFLDVTERRRAEQEILEGVQRREQFLAMLSHELRNPLAAILSATRVLDNATWTDRPCQEAGQVVTRQANHMSRLLDDLLDVARITRGRITLRNEVVDLREAARSAIEALAPFMHERETNLQVEMPDEPVFVLGDAARLQQVQANLLSNASKYSPAGAPVTFTLRVEEDQAVISVKDAGQGIDPAMLPRIFELFVQGDQSLARSEGGLGIGLTLLRSLVELHHGRVEAYSEGRDRGSTFTVYLPIAPVSALRSDLAAGVPQPVRTVVLVEDQVDARRMMQLLLEGEGIEVHLAENGLEGARLIERVRPDLAIVDLGLPVMSGYDLARRVRKNHRLDTVRLVALSGYGQDSDIQAALAAGFDEHLTKPPDPDRLDALLGHQAPHDQAMK
ncbi:MAG TPA: chemotaxis protein CheB [Vicinamibacterales bacterium]|nr:chemotaxis protein CheB [Vicinamibacterales bacterium]